jgi:hypothetical protein
VLDAMRLARNAAPVTAPPTINSFFIFHASSPVQAFSLRHRLLPRPGGFEGLRVSQPSARFDALFVAPCEEDRDLLIELDAAGKPETNVAQGRGPLVGATRFRSQVPRATESRKKGEHNTVATKTKTNLVVCWRSFAGNDVAGVKGRRYRTDDPIVTEHPDHFVSADLPESEWPNDNFFAPVPEPIGRVKLRVLPVEGDRKLEELVLHRGRGYRAGDTFEAEGRDAEHLLDVGVCEVVKKLR